MPQAVLFHAIPGCSDTPVMGVKATVPKGCPVLVLVEIPIPEVKDRT